MRFPNSLTGLIQRPVCLSASAAELSVTVARDAEPESRDAEPSVPSSPPPPSSSRTPLYPSYSSSPLTPTATIARETGGSIRSVEPIPTEETALPAEPCERADSGGVAPDTGGSTSFSSSSSPSTSPS